MKNPLHKTLMALSAASMLAGASNAKAQQINYSTSVNENGVLVPETGSFNLNLQFPPAEFLPEDSIYATEFLDPYGVVTWTEGIGDSAQTYTHTGIYGIWYGGPNGSSDVAFINGWDFNTGTASGPGLWAMSPTPGSFITDFDSPSDISGVYGALPSQPEGGFTMNGVTQGALGTINVVDNPVISQQAVDVSYMVTQVPEPGVIGLSGLGAGLLVIARRRGIGSKMSGV
jgi:hypothetical protein